MNSSGQLLHNLFLSSTFICCNNWDITIPLVTISSLWLSMECESRIRKVQKFIRIVPLSCPGGEHLNVWNVNDSFENSTACVCLIKNDMDWEDPFATGERMTNELVGKGENEYLITR